MNGSEPKIEIFKPFGEAFELTKKILFQPFNFEKWLVIGFAAFLTHLNGGGFNGFRLPANSDWTKQAFSQPDSVRSFIDQIAPVWWILIGVAVLLCIAIFVVLTWIRSRGHFIFIEVSDRITMQVLVSLLGISIMIAVASLISWYKEVEGRGSGTGPKRPDADLAGGRTARVRCRAQGCRAHADTGVWGSPRRRG